MLIQKTFHLGMTKEAARAKLLNLREYRNELHEVERAEVEDGAAYFDFRIPGGFPVRAQLTEVPGENPAQTLFRSYSGGNVEVLGVLEFFEIKPDLTEVVLTIDYSFLSPFLRLVDYFTSGVERFIDRQLERVENHFAKPVAGVRADRNLPAPINGNPIGEEEEGEK